jgi:hypothetical protein
MYPSFDPRRTGMVISPYNNEGGTMLRKLFMLKMLWEAFQRFRRNQH